jgi:hypothetical protein
MLTCRYLILTGKMCRAMATSRCSPTRTQSYRLQSSSWRSCVQRSRHAHTSTAHPIQHGSCSGSDVRWGGHNCSNPCACLGLLSSYNQLRATNQAQLFNSTAHQEGPSMVAVTLLLLSGKLGGVWTGLEGGAGCAAGCVQQDVATSQALTVHFQVHNMHCVRCNWGSWVEQGVSNSAFAARAAQLCSTCCLPWVHHVPTGGLWLQLFVAHSWCGPQLGCSRKGLESWFIVRVLMGTYPIAVTCALYHNLPGWREQCCLPNMCQAYGRRLMALLVVWEPIPRSWA